MVDNKKASDKHGLDAEIEKKKRELADINKRLEQEARVKFDNCRESYAAWSHAAELFRNAKAAGRAIPELEPQVRSGFSSDDAIRFKDIMNCLEVITIHFKDQNKQFQLEYETLVGIVEGKLGIPTKRPSLNFRRYPKYGTTKYSLAWFVSASPMEFASKWAKEAKSLETTFSLMSSEIKRLQENVDINSENVLFSPHTDNNSVADTPQKEMPSDTTGDFEKERKLRFAKRDGSGGEYKRVQFTLHKDLIPNLKTASDGSTQSAWVEDAIREKLARETVPKPK